jgi:hypothetical protein
MVPRVGPRDGAKTMGKLARLNAAVKTGGKTAWFLAVKTDFSYELAEDVDGQQVVEKVDRYHYVPMGTPSGWVLSYKSQDECRAWLRDKVNTVQDAEFKALRDLDVWLLEVRYAPDKRRAYDQDWAKANVLQAVKTDIKDFRSAEIK